MGSSTRSVPGRLLAFTADADGVLYATRLDGLVAVGSSANAVPLAGTEHALTVDGIDSR